MDYLHTVILFVVIIIFAMTTYANNPIIGSIEKMYTLLQNAGKVQPADGNRNGEYLTMASTGGIEFGVITLVQGFGTVFVDNAYWQRGIAAHPRYAVQGYLAGGLAWYAIPFATATTLGLAGRALLIDIAEMDVSAGLVLPQVAVLLLGQSGAVMALLVVFMAVTSALSAEMIAVSSIGTYDIYQAYINPEATNKQIKLSADTLIVSYGIFSGILAIILNNIGITIGYLYNLTGLMISSAVAPLICTLMWKKQNLLAVTIAPLMGTGCGFISWLVTSHILYNEITITSTIKNFPILAGNLVCIMMIIISYCSSFCGIFSWPLNPLPP
jgi:Na+/proline symporter